MSRYIGEDRSAEPIITAAEQWRDECVLSGGSVLGPNKLWTSENITELEVAFVQQPEVGEGAFITKFEEQLKKSSVEVKQLAAEMLWLMLLCPYNIRYETKLDIIRTVWSWSEQSLDVDQSLLSDQTLTGVGSAGQAYNILRPLELTYLVRVCELLLKMPIDDRRIVFSDRTTLAEQLESVPDNEKRQFRHMFLYMLFPDISEKIFAKTERVAIVSVFTESEENEIWNLTALQLDNKLSEIRKEQERKHGTSDLDFYQSPLREEWYESDNEEGSVSEKASDSYTHTQPEDKLPMNETPRNIIFYGPPGTGKTHKINNLREKYREMATSVPREQWLLEQLDGHTWFEVILMALHDLETRAELKDIYSHKFVILKADLGNNQFSNARVRATINQHCPESPDQKEFNPSRPKEVFGKDGDIRYLLAGCKDEYGDLASKAELLKKGPTNGAIYKRYEFVTFHQSFGYEEFVEGIRPVQDEDTDGIAYRVTPGVFRKICDKAKRDPSNRHAIFIDEINRGNIAKILGELITLIEPDKRCKPSNGSGHDETGMVLTLPYSNAKFGVPDNLDIYGTMNTADRSIALMDTALRRRFEFEELMPDSSLIEGISGDGTIDDGNSGTIDLRKLLDTMNRRIRLLHNRDLMLGHAYFMKVRSFDELKEVILRQVLPLLQEYFYNDWHKIQRVLRDIRNDNERINPQIIRNESIPVDDHLDIEDDANDYTVAKTDEITPQAIRKIYEVDG